MISNSPNLDFYKVLMDRSRDSMRNENKNKNDKPVWLITFVDLISLLLAFFLMLYSMSSVKKNDWATFLASLDKQETLLEKKKEGSKKEMASIPSAETSK